jgi:hypothetical protein
MLNGPKSEKLVTKECYRIVAWNFHVADTDQGFHTLPAGVGCHLL